MKAKKPHILFACLIALLISAAAVAGDLPAPAADAPATTADTDNAQTTTLSVKDVQRFGAAVKAIKNYYVEPVSDQKLFDEAIRGMLAGLDPHSSYLNADDLRELRDQTTGEFSGLGIEISGEDGLIKVISPLDDSPAQKAGIKPGDLIILINNVPVKGMALNDAVKKMRGKTGSAVVLTVLRKSEQKPLRFNLVRADIHVKSVKGRLLEDDFGYVRISSFQTETGKMLADTIKSLQQQAHGKLQGLVLDLRNDPGGLLDSAVQVSDDFIDVTPGKKKLVVFTKGRLPSSHMEIYATPGDLLNGAPMVVLINGGSASGSEIVAGALQDYKRAVIMGTNSFGKGSVQTIIPLDDSTAIKLTTALYYTPNGRSIQAKGIHPDVVVDEYKLTESEKILDSIKEADLEGHLANGNAKSSANTAVNTAATITPEASNTKTEAEEPTTAAGIAATDNQLFAALNLLKGLLAEREANN